MNRWPLAKDLSNHLGIRHGSSVRRSARGSSSLGRPRVARRLAPWPHGRRPRGMFESDSIRERPLRVRHGVEVHGERAASISIGRTRSRPVTHPPPPGGQATRSLESVVTWLILPVVICLSQRLSHACLSISNIYSETANGSLNQLSFI